MQSGKRKSFKTYGSVSEIFVSILLHEKHNFTGCLNRLICRNAVGRNSKSESIMAKEGLLL